MPVPPQYKKVVAFVYGMNECGKRIALGTAFLVGVQKPGEEGTTTGYLVTAKHVLLQDQATGVFRPKVEVRVGMKEGGTQFLDFTLRPDGEGKNVFVSPDPSVDIAVVFPFVVNQQKYDVFYELILAVDDQNKWPLQEGMDVFFVGLFTPYQGADKNYPIVRYGRLALITNERIPLKGRDAELLLIDTFSFGGNSGAPVYLCLGPDQIPGKLFSVTKVVPKLVGIMLGYFSSASSVEEIPTGNVLVSKENMGIAAVAPVEKLREILFSEEMISARGW